MSVIFEALIPVAALVAAATGAVATAFVDWAKDNWRNKFREQLKSAVVRECLTYTDLQHVAERWNQDRQAVLQSLRVLLSDAVAGENKDVSEKLSHIRELLIEHQYREPFAELPENISIQLAALQPVLSDRPDAVPQLATSLSELYSKNQRELVRQKKLAIWGFVVGILGLLASVPGLYSMWKS